MKITDGCRVIIEYGLTDDAGTLLEDTSEDGPVEYTHGQGEILPGLEAGLAGADSGSEVTLDLEPEDAYGPYDPEGLFIVPRSEFPADAELSPGDSLEVHVADDETDEAEEHDHEDCKEHDHNVMEVVVAEVKKEEVVLDANHPLAGKRVTFRIKVLSVTPPA